MASGYVALSTGSFSLFIGPGRGEGISTWIRGNLLLSGDDDIQPIELTIYGAFGMSFRWMECVPRGLVALIAAIVIGQVSREVGSGRNLKSHRLLNGIEIPEMEKLSMGTLDRWNLSTLWLEDEKLRT